MVTYIFFTSHPIASNSKNINFQPKFVVSQYIFRQIICWQSRGTTTLMEVKLDYFRGHGSTTAVAVKNQVQLKKLRIAKFIQKLKKKFTATSVVLPQPRKQCNFTSITVVVPRLYLQMIWRKIYLDYIQVDKILVDIIQVD